MVHQAVLDARLSERHLMMRLRQLLQVVRLFDDGVVEALRVTVAQQVEDDLRVLRVVLVPGVMQRLAGACHREAGGQSQLEALGAEEVSETAVVIGRWLEGDQALPTERAQVVGEPAELRELVADDHLLTAAVWQLDEDIVLELGDVDGYQDGRRWCRVLACHARFSFGRCLLGRNTIRSGEPGMTPDFRRYYGT